MVERLEALFKEADAAARKAGKKPATGRAAVRAADGRDRPTAGPKTARARDGRGAASARKKKIRVPAARVVAAGAGPSRSRPCLPVQTRLGSPRRAR